MVGATISNSGGFTSWRQMTPTSRATPARLRQSPRLGVRSTSMMVSSKSRYSRKLVPTGASAGSGMSPSELSARPSSEAEQSIPMETTPRSFDFLILKSPGSLAPINAVGATIPSWTLGAPQTICSGSSAAVATSTVQTLSLSASGWASILSTRPTTTPLNSAATGSTPSSSSPAMVSW